MEQNTIALGMLVVTVVAALSAASGAAASWALYRHATEPHVVVYATPDPSRPTLVVLVIENIGKGMAYDVTFRFDQPIVHQAWGLTADTAPAASATIGRGPLITGIPALGPGAKRVYNWGQVGGLLKAIGSNTVQITATYGTTKDSLAQRETTSWVEVFSFDDTDAVDPDGARQCARELRKIKHLLRRPLDVRLVQAAGRGNR